MFYISYILCIGNRDDDERIKSDKADQCPNTSIKMCVASVGETSDEPSVVVNQIAVHVSPVMQKYKRYLQSVYQARDLAHADKYLPTLKSKYINLAMVSKEMCSRNKRDMFTKATLHGGVDEILEKKSPITMAELMIPEEGKGPVTFILVEGPPGIGKSTFAWELCRRWDEILKLREYHAVVLIKLREKWALNATSLSELFRHTSNSDLGVQIAVELEESQGKNLALALDGFDEVSHSFHEESVLKRILRKEVLPKCSIVLTTRPSAHSILKEIFQPQVSKHIEIIGFTEEERVKYITEVFSDEHDVQRNFLKYMFKVPHIKSMMYIPLNCAIIAKVYHEALLENNVVIPKTRTQLYKALTHSLLLRYLKSKNTTITFPSGCSMLPECLNDDEMMKFKVLAKFAFETYHDVTRKKITFFEEDMPRGMIHFGFMNESTELYASRGMERTFTFLHLSLQEYLASWHLANSCSVECQVAYYALGTCRYSDRDNAINHEVMKYAEGSTDATELISKLLLIVSQFQSLIEPAVFLAGITSFKSQCRKTLWESYLSNVNKVTLEMLTRSLFEAQNPLICSKYFSFSSDTFWSNRAYHYYALSYCVSYCSSECNIKVGFDDTNCVEMFVRGLQDHWKSTSSPRTIGLLLKRHRYNLDSECDSLINSLLWLSEAPHSFLAVLEEVSIEGPFLCFPNPNYNTILNNLLQKLIKVRILHITSIPSERGVEILNFMSFGHLNVLHLIGRHYNLQQVHSICRLIETTLTELDFNPLISFDECAFPRVIHFNIVQFLEKILDSVLLSGTMRKLVLYCLCQSTMGKVQSVLLHCSLEELCLLNCRLGYDGILFICSALSSNTSLKTLIIYDNQRMQNAYESYNFQSDVHICHGGEQISLFSTASTTSVLLELNNFLKTNSTLINLRIESGMLRPNLLEYTLPYCYEAVSIDHCRVTPFRQFSAEYLASDIIPTKLKRSHSEADLLQEPSETDYSERDSYIYNPVYRHHRDAVFQQLFLTRRNKGKKCSAMPSFTAPDIDLLQPLSHLDPRLQECLGVTGTQRREMTNNVCDGMKEQNIMWEL